MLKKTLIFFLISVFVLLLVYKNTNNQLQENFDWTQINTASKCIPQCNNHGTFQNGKCVCTSGWSGDNCEKSSGNIPTTLCTNGKVVNNVCQCNPGWTGTNCDKPSSGPTTSEYNSTPVLVLDGTFIIDGKFNINDPDWNVEDHTSPDNGNNMRKPDSNITGCQDSTHASICYGKWSDLISKTPDNKLKITVGDIKNPNINIASNKRAIRMSSNKKFNGGLFIFDVEHIPFGKAAWPAYWLTGDDWPDGGEIDIIENVYNSSTNQSTIHTKYKCTQDSNKKFIYTDCTTGYNLCSVGPCLQNTCQNPKDPAKSNCIGSNPSAPTLGCGAMAPPNSFGDNFNSNGGGVYVTEWLLNGDITMWLFKRDDFNNLNSQYPLSPSQWKKQTKYPPYVVFNTDISHCQANALHNMKIVINTAICGEWASQYFNHDMGTCNTYILKNSLPDAYWLINYLKVYTLK